MFRNPKHLILVSQLFLQVHDTLTQILSQYLIINDQIHITAAVTKKNPSKLINLQIETNKLNKKSVRKMKKYSS